VLSLASLGGDPSGNRVVVDETESSMSDVVDGVGELARSEFDDEAFAPRFLERIFCEILV